MIERKKYLDFLQTHCLSPQYERVIKNSINPALNVKKVVEGNSPSPDFMIESEKIIIEVTTLKSEPINGKFSISENQLISKINEALFHIDSKKEKHDSYFLIGCIFISNIINTFTDLGKPEIFITF